MFIIEEKLYCVWKLLIRNNNTTNTKARKSILTMNLYEDSYGYQQGNACGA